jgi:SnoaL-like domain
MSDGNVEVVRKPLRVRERSRRTLDQRLALRFPRLSVASVRLLGRLAPGSRLRQASLWRAVRLSVEAFNRRDLEAFLLIYHPDFEFRPPREFVEAGLGEPCYRGPAGFRKYVSDWSEVWGEDLRLVPVELIDLGDRVVVLSDLPVRGTASGVRLTGQFRGSRHAEGWEGDPPPRLPRPRRSP